PCLIRRRSRSRAPPANEGWRNVLKALSTDAGPILQSCDQRSSFLPRAKSPEAPVLLGLSIHSRCVGCADRRSLRLIYRAAELQQGSWQEFGGFGLAQQWRATCLGALFSARYAHSQSASARRIRFSHNPTHCSLISLSSAGRRTIGPC